MARNPHTHKRRVGPKKPIYHIGDNPDDGRGTPRPKYPGGPGNNTPPAIAALPPAPTGQQAGPPVDPGLVAQQNAANLNIGLGNAWDVYKTGQINAQYGNLDAPQQDALSNPFSLAALAVKRYGQQQTGSTNSYAAQGQQYSSALQHQKEENLFGYNQNLAGLRQQKQGALDNLTAGALDRYSQAGVNLSGDALKSLLNQLGLS